jgi:hypothetical protein
MIPIDGEKIKLKADADLKDLSTKISIFAAINRDE